jgi:hypothetical protein
MKLVLWILNNGLIYTYKHFLNLYIETSRPNTKRLVHAHKCLHCAGIEPAASSVVGEYSHHYATSTTSQTRKCYAFITQTLLNTS